MPLAGNGFSGALNLNLLVIAGFVIAGINGAHLVGTVDAGMAGLLDQNCLTSRGADMFFKKPDHKPNPVKNAWAKALSALSPGPRHGWPGRELAKALEPVAGRVALRYWLESARLALLWGLAAAFLVLALLRLYPLVPPVASAVAGCATALAVAALRVHLRPDALAVVRVADELGLNGDAVTAFRLLEAGASDPWSRAAVERSVAACAALSAKVEHIYPAVPAWRPWHHLALLVTALAVLQVVPDPLGSYWAERREERRALVAAAEEARRAVDEIRELKINGKDVLPEEIKKKLGELPREVAGAVDPGEAAARLEKARWELDSTRAVIDPSAQRDINKLAAAWQGMEGKKEWRDMAQALQNGDEKEIAQSVQKLTAKLKEAGEEEKFEAAATMFASAAMVENPELRRALRDTAAAILSSGGDAGAAGNQNNAGQSGSGLDAAANTLASALSGAASAASAGAALGNASATLAALAMSLTGSGARGNHQLAGNNGAGDEEGGQSPAAGQAGAGTSPGGTSAGTAHGPGET